MPEEYRKVVFDAYQKKKRDGSLSSNLLDPTPGNVREECLIIYRERERNPKDDEIFKQFFKGVDKEKGYLTVLENSLAEKFKQMPKILKGGVPKYGLRYAELLAWLIDFQPRPSTSYYTSFYKDKPSDIKVVIDTPDDEIQTDTTEGNDTIVQNQKEEEESNIDRWQEKQNDSNEKAIEIIDKPTDPDIEQLCDNDKKKEKGVEILEPVIEIDYESLFSSRYIIIACILLLFIGTTSFVAWENSTASVRMPEADEKCMYWNEDHYEPVKCDAQINGVTIIPLDLKKLQHQRKINLPDTLTTYSLGKVWYKGFVKDHEFFTDSGAYPQDIQRILKPLTNTILTKYTSNYRYMLTRLVWFLCAALFVSLCGIGASKTKKKIKVGNQNETSNGHIEDFTKTNSPIIT